MSIFVTGTDTNIGKTVISSWLALHTKSRYYFKPIQTGAAYDDIDSAVVKSLVPEVIILPELYVYDEPVAPYLAANKCGIRIDDKNLELPQLEQDIIVEGAGGLLVPINESFMMIDLIKKFNIPTVLVASSRLGTINHTLLSLEALRARDITILGVVINGEPNQDNCDAIEYYGDTKIIAQFPLLESINNKTLQAVPFQSFQYELI